MARVAEDKKPVTARMLAARESRRKAYGQRNELIGLVAHLYPGSHRMAAGGALGSLRGPTSRQVICLHPPTGGPLCYVVTPEEVAEHFSHLEEKPNHWDKSSAVERSNRIAALRGITTAATAAPPEPRRPGDFSRRRK